MSVQGRRQLAQLLERHGLHPRRGLGQHFLADPNLVRKIVATAGVGPGSQVVEIGAGTGTLTAGLVDAGAEVVAYEVDEALRPLLSETVGRRADLRFADATRVDLDAELGSGTWSMVANLPYNVGTPILLDALRRVERIRRFTVMVQAEVADRLVATPGDEAYGLPSVVVALHGTARVAFTVSPGVFLPPPQVGSAVVVIERRPAPASADAAIELAGRAFRQRRKMLRRSLAEVVGEASLEAAGIDPTARPEEIPPEAWLALAAETGDGA